MVTKDDVLVTVDETTVEFGAPLGYFLVPMRILRWVTQSVVEVEIGKTRKTTWTHAVFLVPAHEAGLHVTSGTFAS